MDKGNNTYLKRGRISTALFSLVRLKVIVTGRRTMRYDAIDDVKGAGTLAESLFRLPDPWRDRFLSLVEYRAIGEVNHGDPPSQEDVTSWLADLNLYREVTLMLSSWQHSAV
jgi:hypothetical protein